MIESFQDISEYLYNVAETNTVRDFSRMRSEDLACYTRFPKYSNKPFLNSRYEFNADSFAYMSNNKYGNISWFALNISRGKIKRSFKHTTMMQEDWLGTNVWNN